MKKILIALLAVLALTFPTLAAPTSELEDCGRSVEVAPGSWAPLNLCPDGSIPDSPGCTCPGKRKWDSSASFTKVKASHTLRITDTMQPKTQVAYPKDIDQYPILKKGDLTKERATEMKLRLTRLQKTEQMLNWSRNLNRFLYEILPVGTWVWVNEKGIPVYKADCDNRLARLEDCPKCPPNPVTSGVGGALGGKNPGNKLANGTSGTNLPGELSSKKMTGWPLLGAALTGIGKAIASVGGWTLDKLFNWLLPLLIFLAILAALAFAALMAARAIRNGIRDRRRTTPAHGDHRLFHPEEPVVTPRGVATGAETPRMPIVDRGSAAVPTPTVVPPFPPFSDTRPSFAEAGAGVGGPPSAMRRLASDEAMSARPAAGPMGIVGGGAKDGSDSEPLAPSVAAAPGTISATRYVTVTAPATVGGSTRIDFAGVSNFTFASDSEGHNTITFS